MSRFEEKPTSFNGLFEVNRNILRDNRGYLERLFCINDLKCWKNRPLRQVNRTFTEKKATIRGLHFQHPPYTEAKFISCLSGVIFDVALDLRLQSETYGKIFTIELDAQKHNSVFIPEGFAHGFQSLTSDVEILYFHSVQYEKAYEDGINVFDPTLKIEWLQKSPQVSDRDLNFQYFKNFSGLNL